MVNNWPTEDCSLLVWEGHANNEGTYALSFNGKATVSVSYGYGTGQRRGEQRGDV